MTSEQIKALMEVRRAASKREAAMQIYMSAPSGVLGGIARSCRESLEKAMHDEMEAKSRARILGCDIGLLEGGKSTARTD